MKPVNWTNLRQRFIVKSCCSSHRMASLLLLLSFVLLCASAFIVESSWLPRRRAPRAPFRCSGGPFTIAHRGSCGEFPESSAPGFKKAIEEGIDFIETDITSTKDGVLVCLHDITLDAITDVANRPEYANRKTTYESEGHNVTGYFAVDFSLKELQTLLVHQRFKSREQSHNGLYKIITFEEFIAIALNADRVVGIDPEIKSPIFVNQHVKWADGLFEDKFVATLLKYGYTGSYLSKNWLRQPVFIQTFAPNSIITIANQTRSPKVFNIGNPASRAQGTQQLYSELMTDTYLDYMKQFIIGVSVDKNMILPIDKQTRKLLPASDIVDRAHARGLQVHPATFRNEAEFMAMDFRADPYRELDAFARKIGVDALMTDYPATLSSYSQAFVANLTLWD